jgi:hypothetical protein
MKLTISEAGYCKNVSPDCVRQAIRKGKLKAEKVPYPGPVGYSYVIDSADLEKWETKGTIGEHSYQSGYYRNTVKPERRRELDPLFRPKFTQTYM